MREALKLIKIFKICEAFAPNRMGTFCQSKGVHLFRVGLLEMVEEEIG